MITIYRFESKAAVQSSQVFQGQGSLISDGRWHTSPRQIVYCAGEIALAVLEVRVNTLGVKSLPTRYLVSTTIDKKQIKEVEVYPSGWRNSPALSETQDIGNNWYDQNQSLILKVKSSIVPEAFNYLINATHPDFQKLTVSPAVEYDLDPRLWK